MNKPLAVKILLLYGICYIKADVQELLPSNKLNTNYLPVIKEERTVRPLVGRETKLTENNLNYRHNQPKVIEDPLPMKVEHIKPIDIDFVTHHNRPILKGVFITTLYVDVHDTKKRMLFEPTPNNVNKFRAINKTEGHVKATHHDLKAESSIESKIYGQKRDVASTNSFAGHAIKCKIFNCDNGIEISDSAPEVIYKPGDDITFSTDTTVIDDYDHTLDEENINNRTTTKSSAKEKPAAKYSKATEHSFNKKQLKTNGNDNTITSASTLHAATAADSYSSEATKHSVVREKSESIQPDHGYFYDKPKIPFTF